MSRERGVVVVKNKSTGEEKCYQPGVPRIDIDKSRQQGQGHK
jgi:hypothetical protein